MKRIKIYFTISIMINIIALGFATRRLYYMYQDYNLSSNARLLFNRQGIYSILPIDSTDIVFIGDSQIQNFDIQEFILDYKIKNRGISGDATKGVYNRISELEGKPKKVFIEVGTNDIHSKTPTDSSMNYMIKIILYLKNNSPVTKIYVQSVLPRNEFLVDGYNNRLKQVCRESGVTYINLYDSFTTNGNLNKEYDCGDGLHLNGQGYLLWSKLLKPYL
jgi:hypothetical protein